MTKLCGKHPSLKCVVINHHSHTASDIKSNSKEICFCTWSKAETSLFLPKTHHLKFPNYCLCDAALNVETCSYFLWEYLLNLSLI